MESSRGGCNLRHDTDLYANNSLITSEILNDVEKNASSTSNRRFYECRK